MPKVVKKETLPITEWVALLKDLAPNEAIRLTQGEDFDCSPKTIQEYLWAYARKEKIPLRAKIGEENGVAHVDLTLKDKPRKTETKKRKLPSPPPKPPRR